MLLRSQNRSKYTRVVSIGPLRFEVSNVNPRIRPIKMAKNMSRMRAAFSVSNAYGSTI